MSETEGDDYAGSADEILTETGSAVATESEESEGEEDSESEASEGGDEEEESEASEGEAQGEGEAGDEASDEDDGEGSQRPPSTSSRRRAAARAEALSRGRGGSGGGGGRRRAAAGRPAAHPVVRAANLALEAVYVPDELRMTDNRLHQTELARVLGARAEQLAAPGALFFGESESSDPVQMAIDELAQRRCPLLVLREVERSGTAVTYERWRVNEMVLPNLPETGLRMR